MTSFKYKNFKNRIIANQNFYKQQKIHFKNEGEIMTKYLVWEQKSPTDLLLCSYIWIILEEKWSQVDAW